MNHKHSKFQGQLNLIRWELNPYVAFFVSGKDLSLASDAIDLDFESDIIIKNLRENQIEDSERYAFEYRVGTGFEEVDPYEQTWFNFK